MEEKEAMWQRSYVASQSLKYLLSESLEKKFAELCINNLYFKHFENRDGDGDR